MNLPFAGKLINGMVKRVQDLTWRYSPSVPNRGWIRSVRDARGMSSYKLADRIGVAQSTVMQWEEGEQRGSITLHSLRKVADALECDLIYALAPRSSAPIIPAAEPDRKYRAEEDREPIYRERPPREKKNAGFAWVD